MEGRAKKRKSGKRMGSEDSKRNQPRPKVRLRLNKVVRDDEMNQTADRDDEQQTFTVLKILDRLTKNDSAEDEERNTEKNDPDEDEERNTKKNDSDGGARMVDEVLGKQFIKLYQEDRIGNRWELVDILSVLLDLGDITSKDFKKLTNILLSEKEVTKMKD